MCDTDVAIIIIIIYLLVCLFVCLFHLSLGITTLIALNILEQIDSFAALHHMSTVRVAQAVIFADYDVDVVTTVLFGDSLQHSH